MQRHLQYENYILNDVLPLMWNRNWNPRTIVTGCSFGAYHALNFAMRHPDKVTDCVSMGGSLRHQALPERLVQRRRLLQQSARLPGADCNDGWRYNHIRTVLSTGEWDMCWNDNSEMAAIMGSRGIRHEMYVWGDQSYHDWPWWRPMARAYLG